MRNLKKLNLIEVYITMAKLTGDNGTNTKGWSTNKLISQVASAELLKVIIRTFGMANSRMEKLMDSRDGSAKMVNMRTKYTKIINW